MKTFVRNLQSVQITDRTSLCTLPKALVELAPSACEVNVPPKIALDMDFSAHSIIAINDELSPSAAF